MPSICPRCRGPLEIIDVTREVEVQGEYHPYLDNVTEQVFACLECLQWWGQNTARPKPAEEE